MKRKLRYALLASAVLAAGTAGAQCTATLTSSGDCYPITLTVTATYGMDTIKWKENGIITQTYAATTATTGLIVAGGNGQGNAANQLNQAMGMFIDASGNIYIADGPNHRVQKWAPNATTGVTVAGGNGQGNAANQLNFPVSVYVDNNGNIYVSESINNRVSKWAPNATAGTVVAGGNGMGAAANQLNFAGGIFVKDGDIYIMDSGNSRVQKWAANATTGVTVAGGNGFGTALNQIGNPTLNGSIHVDNSNNIYICEYSNQRVTKWLPNATAGVVVAGGNGQGNAANQFNYPAGIFVDNSNNIYVAEYGNHRVQLWAPGATSGVTVAGGNGAGPALNQTSQAVAVTKTANDLYVLEYGNHRVTKFSNTSTITNTYTINGPGIYKAIVKGSSCEDSVTFDASLPLHIILTPDIDFGICEGSTATLRASQHPSLSYQWLKDGVNTGTGADSLVISDAGAYAVITNINNGCVDTTDTVVVTVHPLPEPVITNNNNVLSTGTYTTYQWYKNTAAISGANSAAYTVTEDGSYSVEVTDGNGCMALSDALNVDIPLGLKDFRVSNALRVYPNPAKQQLHIRIAAAHPALTLSILDLQGRVMMKSDAASNALNHPFSLNIHQLAPGLYQLRIQGDGINIVEKVIKQ
jgi:hypothetical protein